MPAISGRVGRGTQHSYRARPPSAGAAESCDQFEHCIARPLAAWCHIDLVRSRPPCRAASSARARVSGSVSGLSSPRGCISSTALDRRFPSFEALGDVGSCVGISLGSLAAQRANGHPPLQSSSRWAAITKSRQARRPSSVLNRTSPARRPLCRPGGRHCPDQSRLSSK